MDDLTTRLTSILRRHLLFLDGDQELGMSDALLELGLDSTGAIGLLLDLEATFSISFPDEMLVPETFHTPAALLEAIRALTDAGRETGPPCG